MRLLLDTSAYSYLVKGHPEVAWLVRSSRRIFVSSIVLGELLYGFRGGRKLDENTARLEAFLDRPDVTLLPVGRTTAERYGLIATALRRKGAPVPANDLWIAAHALETGADILSSDPHFGLIDGVSWISFSPGSEDSVRERIHSFYAGTEVGPVRPHRRPDRSDRPENRPENRPESRPESR